MWGTMVDQSYLYDVAQASFMLRLSEEEVQRICEAGILEFTRSKDDILFSREAIDNFRIQNLSQDGLRLRLGIIEQI